MTPMTPSEGCSVDVLEMPLEEKAPLVMRRISVRKSLRNFRKARLETEICRSTEMIISDGSPPVLRIVVARPRFKEGVEAKVESSH